MESVGVNDAVISERTQHIMRRQIGLIVASNYVLKLLGPRDN